MVNVKLIIYLINFLSSLENKNLVLNGGFEYNQTIMQGISIDSSKKYYWSYLNDYDSSLLNSINVCHTKIVDWYTSAAPCTDIGFCQPYKGNGFAIINGYSSLLENRGYLLGSLRFNLEKGKKYYVSFYIKKAPCSGYEVNLYGVSFANRHNVYDYVYKNNYPNLTCLDNAKIYVENKLNAGSYDNWKIVEGEFIANGDEEKIIIGCFRNNKDLIVTKNHPKSDSDPCGCKSFSSSKDNGLVFIDNISVILIE